MAALDSLASHFSLPAMRVATNNKPVGAVRASVGYGSDSSDIDALLDFLKAFVAELPPPNGRSS